MARKTELQGIPLSELAHGRERMSAFVGQLMTLTAISPAHDISPDDSIELSMEKLNYNALAIRALPTFRKLFELARRDYAEINAVFTERIIGEAERYEQTVATARERVASITASAAAHSEFQPALIQAQAFVQRLEAMPGTEQGVYLHEGLQLLAERRAQEAEQGGEEPEPPAMPLASRAPEPVASEPVRETDAVYMQKVAIVAAIANELGANTPEQPVNWRQLEAVLYTGESEDGLERGDAVRQILLAVPQAVADRVREGSATQEEQALFAQIQALSADGTVEAFTRRNLAGWINRKMFADDIGDGVIVTLLQQEALAADIEAEAVVAGDSQLAAAAEETVDILDETTREVAATLAAASGPTDPDIALLNGAAPETDETEVEQQDASVAEHQMHNIVFDAISLIGTRASHLLRGEKIGIANIPEKFAGFDFSEADLQANAPYLRMKRGDKTLGIRDLAFLIALKANPPYQGEQLQKRVDRMVIERQVQLILEELRAGYDNIGPGRQFNIQEASAITRIPMAVLLDNKKQELPHSGKKTLAQFTLRNMVAFLCSQRKGYQGPFDEELAEYARTAYDREMASLEVSRRRA